SFQDIWTVFPAAKRFPAHGPAQPRKMTMHWNGVIAAVQHSIYKAGLKAIANMPAADRHIKGAGDTVEVRVTTREFDEHVEVLGVKEAAFRATVRSNHSDAALQWELERSRIRQLPTHDGHGVLPTRMSQQWQASFSHALPESHV